MKTTSKKATSFPPYFATLEFCDSRHLHIQRPETHSGVVVAVPRADLQVGLDDIEAGRVLPLDIEDMKRRGMKRLSEQKSSGK